MDNTIYKNLVSESNSKYRHLFSAVFYFLLAFFFNYHFLMTTMFFKEHLLSYADSFFATYDFFTKLLFALTVFTIVFLYEKPKDKLLPIAIFLVVLFYDHFREIHTRRDVAVFFMLLICSKYKDFRKMGWLFYSCGWIWIIASYIACRNGYLTDIVYGNGTRHAFGSIYVTDLACHVFTLIIVLCILRHGKLKLYEYAYIAMVLAINLLFMKAKVSFLCTFLIVAITLYNQFIAPRVSDNKLMKRTIKVVALSSFIIFALASMYLTYNYSEDPNVLYNRLSIFDTIRGRLYYGKIAMDDIPIKMWGTVISERGNGGVQPGTVTDYFFLDISYIRLLFHNGPIILTTIIVIFVKTQYRLAKYENVYLLAITIVFAFDCFVEHHIIETAYSFIPYLLFVDGSSVVDYDGTSEKINPRSLQ